MPTQMGAQYGEEIFPNLGATVARVGEKSVGEINKRTDLAMQQEAMRQRMMDLWNERNAGAMARVEEQNKFKGAENDEARAAKEKLAKDAMIAKMSKGLLPNTERTVVLPGGLYQYKERHAGFDESGLPNIEQSEPELTEYGKAQTAAIPVKAEAAKTSAGASVTRAEKEPPEKRAVMDEVDKIEYQHLLSERSKAEDDMDTKRVAKLDARIGAIKSKYSGGEVQPVTPQKREPLDFSGMELK